MRYLVGTVVFLFVALCVQAADTGNPNTLTPEQIADGWILLFDGATTFGWKIDGDAKAADGKLILGGGKATVATPPTGFQDFELRFESQGVAQVVVDTGNGRSGLGLTNQKTMMDLKVSAGKHVASGDDLKVGQDGTARHQASITYDGSHRGILRFQVPAGRQLALIDVKLKPVGLKPIFNGKDLSGWKEFKGAKYKSKFTVTPQGWINIKNGPGDLQTDEQWDDFVLQIDCLSNGDRLNSGVFFRCRPNEYQNGYEAQIHNGFTAPPGKEYAIEEFDPNTHKLIDKKKIKYTAIDYGTGAIYRRMPARFQAAKDHEWFTMTVIAQDNHIATWVNGMQMVDWTDNRPLHDNARQGCKLGKGPISLQGHDPTTDLSFRNIRIAELPKPVEKNGK